MNATSTTSNDPRPVDVSPEMVADWLAKGEAVLVDVREEFEHAAEHIPGATLMPLSRFDADALRRQSGNKRIVFHCRSGKRSTEAAQRFCRNNEQTFHLADGIQSWNSAGRETVRSASAPRIDVMRQVQMTAGSIVLAGVLLGAFVSPWFLILSGFVGSGLIFAGASGWCGMALLLAKMPWNRDTNSGASCSTDGARRA